MIDSDEPRSAPSPRSRHRGLSLPAAAVLVALLAGACGRGATVEGVRLDEPALREAAGGIDAAAIRARTAFLSTDFMEGRAPGTRGGALAARYVASEFEAAGLEAGTDEGWYQTVPILGVTPRPTLVFTSRDGRSRYQPAYLEDFVAWTPTQRASVGFAGDVVFVGYGIVAPEFDWNDYAGVDVEGKILLGLVNDPGGARARAAVSGGDSGGREAGGGQPLFLGDTLTYYGRWTYKFEEAARQGAAGMILVHTTETAGYGWPVVQSAWSGEQYEIPLGEGGEPPALHGWLTADAARRVLGMAGVNLDSLMRAAARPGFRARPLPLRAGGRIESRIRRTEAANVVGVVPGRDSTLRDEVVVFTTHYDHLGIGPAEAGDSIYNGAKDNASGTATLVELGRAFASLPERPRRTVMLAAVTAEESGLLGSRYLAENPPRGRFVANVNMDAVNMFGPTSDLVQLGGAYSTLGEVVRGVADHVELELRGDPNPEQGYFFRSDQFSFVQQGVPAVYIEEGTEFVGEPAGTGEERERTYRRERYHQPDDEMLPDYTMEGAAQQARAAFLVGWVAANADSLPRWKPGSPFGEPPEAPAEESGASSARGGR